MTTIIDLGPDDVISANGFYRMPIEQHHSQPCLTRERLAEIQNGDPITPDDQISVTSGVLRTMELATPADVWASSALNPERKEREDTTALRLGRAMASFVEGGADEVLEHFQILGDTIEKPTALEAKAYLAGRADPETRAKVKRFLANNDDRPSKPSAPQIKAFLEGRATPAAQKSIDFWAKVESDPRAELAAKEFDLLVAMGEALVKDPGAVAVMSGEPEITMAVKDERTGLWLLARPDTVSFDGMASDFKKMNTMGRPFNHRLVDQRITQYGYDMQMSIASDNFEVLTEARPGVVVIVAQCDAPPYHVILREILKEDLSIAAFRNRRAITRFAECLKSRDWPGPGADTSFYQRPEWQRTMLLEEMQIAHEAP